MNQPLPAGTLDIGAHRLFADVFGAPPAASARARGRVNLLGEHTDYSDGFVLPTVIPQATTVSLGLASTPGFSLYAADLGQRLHFSLERKPEAHFAQYVYGCLRLLHMRAIDLPALNIHIASEVPMGVGLSSSAALEVASLRALRQLLQLPLNDVDIARLAQRAEIEFAGVQCGIMDQMASSMAEPDSMLFLDTRTLERELLALPDADILVLDSGLPRTLAGSQYNVRRAEVEAAARHLGVAALRDVHDAGVVDALASPWRERARHVVSENQRVLQARAGVDVATFGQLMNDSHASLRDDFQVSVPGLDHLVQLLQQQDAVWGARLTGAGFGGACVALCHRGTAQAVARCVLPAYAAAGFAGRQLVPPEPGPGQPRMS